MKKFDIPDKYRSPIISEIKQIRKQASTRRKDYSPTELDFGVVRFFTARHFGFCFGVENAIETAYRIMAENPDRSIYLLSEIIHNPKVNQDLRDMGIRFIQDNHGNNCIAWDEIGSEDIVIIPAFGSTIAIEQLLRQKGIAIEKYDTTCPFVERVWKRSRSLGKKQYTIIIHGKLDHEETRATFSHAAEVGPALVIQNMSEAKLLAEVIAGENPDEVFAEHFGHIHNRTPDFVASEHLKKVGVVNQTTMLAVETREIADFIRQALAEKYRDLDSREYFANTNDTLCYATSDNQQSLYELLNLPADLAIVVGGYKSANTTHLVELCEGRLPTFFISGADKIIDKHTIKRFDRRLAREVTGDFIPDKEKVNILISSGASCPDAIVEEVIQKVLSFFPDGKETQVVLGNLRERLIAE